MTARVLRPPQALLPGGVGAAAAMSIDEVRSAMGTTESGLSGAEAAQRLRRFGPNAVRTHQVRPWEVLLRQVRSPLLLLLAVTATASFFLGERRDAVTIALILTVSIGLGYINEYRAERASEALHERIRHRALVTRGGDPAYVNVVDLVPGDVVFIQLGEVVPADVRLIAAAGLECDESTLTGEAAPAEKSIEPSSAGTPLAELRCCALMGTVVHAGSGQGIIVATGAHTAFGGIAAGLGERHEDTEFQRGLRRFSVLLAQVAGVLSTAVFVVNLLLHRPLLEALLFALAIAVGITPQLLPAVVSTSLAVGAKQLARRKVLVKRLICIEDLGDIDVLFTDKTGTLTEGDVRFSAAIDPDGRNCPRALLLGLVASDVVAGRTSVVGANPLDNALWEASATDDASGRAPCFRRRGLLPFDHERRLLSVLVDSDEDGPLVVTKGAPEAVLARCRNVPPAADSTLSAQFAAGRRVVAVASRAAGDATGITADDERDLELVGFLVFLDPPKQSAGPALQRLAGLGITVKVLTGDNAAVAMSVCAELGVPTGAVLTGADLDAMDEATLVDHIDDTAVFARVSPEHKARIVRAQRRRGVDVAFLGDGVNDAVALHAADVGISVDTATDVAKDAADVILLEKDLGVLADGVMEGRRIFANTIKYVLMGTSSNFGNMFSAAAASAVLPFLPMLPSQILLNNLLYDTSQLAIATDTVDPEQLLRPTRWDLPLIRRFMLVFGTLSSLFDFATFGVLTWGFHAGATLFRTGWFVESLATQTLVVFVIRTRRTPFFRSRPGQLLLLTATSVVAVGAVLPFLPVAHALDFAAPPASLYAVIGVMVIAYLVLIETAKSRFFARPEAPAARVRRPGYRVARRAARFSAGSGLVTQRSGGVKGPSSGIR